MTPTNDRQEVLNFTEPYSYVPAVVVPEDSDVSDVTTDLDGANIGVCADCTYQFFLEKSLEISGFEFDFVIDDATVTGYDTDTTALQDLALGRLDAVMTSITTAEAFAADNRSRSSATRCSANRSRSRSTSPQTSTARACGTRWTRWWPTCTPTEPSPSSKKWYDGVDVTVVT